MDHVDHNVLSWATAHSMVRPFHEHMLPLVYSKTHNLYYSFFLCGLEATVACGSPNWVKPLLSRTEPKPTVNGLNSNCR